VRGGPCGIACLRLQGAADYSQALGSMVWYRRTGTTSLRPSLQRRAMTSSCLRGACVSGSCIAAMAGLSSQKMSMRVLRLNQDFHGLSAIHFCQTMANGRAAYTAVHTSRWVQHTCRSRELAILRISRSPPVLGRRKQPRARTSWRRWQVALRVRRRDGVEDHE